MPRRMIRDGILTSYRIDRLDAAGERFYFRLMLVADDYGRFSADPRILRSSVFPLKDDVRTADITRWLAACDEAGLLRLYNVGGKEYLEILDFRQAIRAKESKYPHPNTGCDADAMQMRRTCGAHVPVDGDGDGDEDEGGRYPARGAGTHTPAPAREEIPAGYPKSVEEVMAIAADPRCAVEISREQAEAYFLARDTADWIDAARRKIQPGKVYGDLRRWVMKDRQRDGGTAGAASSAEAEFEAMRRQNEAIRRNQ